MIRDRLWALIVSGFGYQRLGRTEQRFKFSIDLDQPVYQITCLVCVFRMNTAIEHQGQTANLRGICLKAC